MLLKDNVIEGLVDNGLDELIVSVTGGSKETYESNHINARWDTLWENLGKLEQKKREKNKHNPVIKFNYITTKKSVTEVNSFIDRIKFFKPKYVTLRELVVFPEMDREYYETNRLTSEDQPKVTEAKQLFLNAGIQPIDSLQCTQENKKMVPNIPEKFPCIEPFFQLFIGPTGDVKVCNNLGSIGNLQHSSLHQIISSSKKNGLLKAIKMKSTCECINNCPNFKS
jgi:MoaA/NifB/PqqE/SkfB family radical SAM enzyme